MRRIGKGTIVVAVLLGSALAAWSVRSAWRVPPPSPPPHVEPRIAQLAAENVAEITNACARFESVLKATSDPPWELFHGLVGHGGDFRIADNTGHMRSCRDWLLHEVSWRPLFRGTPLVTQTHAGFGFARGPHGVMHFEDHFGQFVYILLRTGADQDACMLRVPPDGRQLPLRRFVDDMRLSTSTHLDLSWALPALLSTGRCDPWQNRFGTTVTIDELVEEHVRHRMTGGACWGTHARLALAIIVRNGRASTRPDAHAVAAAALRAALRQAVAGQDDDGQFRPDATATRAEPPSPELAVSFQGHMLEWVMTAVDDETLCTQEWPHLAARCLTRSLNLYRGQVSYGGHCHAISGLRAYRTRVDAVAGWRESPPRAPKTSPP